MSELRGDRRALLSRCRIAALALVASMGVVSDGVSQTTARVAGNPTARTDSIRAEIARINAALAVLEPARQSALRDYRQYDSVAINRLPSDTVIVGPFRVLTDAALIGRTQNALDSAYAQVKSTFGTAADSAIARRTFVIRLRATAEGSRDTVIDIAEVSNGVLDIFDRSPSNADRERLSSGFMTKSGRLMRDRMDSVTVEWLGGMLSPEREGRRFTQRLFIDLLTTPAQVVGRCFGGDLLRCRDALGLTPLPDPLTEWYSPAERRLLVVGKRNSVRAGVLREAYTRCVDGNDYPTCDRLLRTLPEYRLQQPLSNEARHHLMRLALDMGGPTSFNAFVAGTGRTVEQRLAAAAGAPIDTIVSKWRADILAAAPKRQRLQVGTAWATLIWGTFFGILALGARRWL